MKWVIALIISVSAFQHAIAQSDTENLLRNGTFEDEVRYWEVENPAQWDSGEGEQGSGALLMQAPFAKRDRYIHQVKASQCVQLGNADLLYVEARVRYEKLPINSYAHRLSYIWFEDIACSHGGQYGGYLEPKLVDGWQVLSKSGLRPSMNAKSLKIEITQNQTTSERELDWLEQKLKWGYDLVGIEYETPTASAFWDNVFVTPTHFSEAVTTEDIAITHEIGENYLVNASFDEGGIGWRLSSLTRWEEGGGIREDGAVRSSVKSEDSSLGTGVFSQCVKLDGHSHYKMGVSYKKDETSTQSGGGRFRVTWYSEEGCRGSYKTDTNHADIVQLSGWQELVVDGLTRPESAHSAKVTMIQSVAGAGEYAGYWDDAYFVAVAGK